MRYRVLPYRQGSRSAKALAEALDGKVLKLEGSKFVPKGGDVIINWGNTRAERPWIHPMANEPYNVHTVSNKLTAFVRFANENVPIPQFWTNRDAISDDAFPIVCRTELAGHSGAGIVIADTRGQLVPAPLYTQYIKKQDEYRIHVGKRVTRNWDITTQTEDIQYVTIAVQRKARSLSVPDADVNWQVRSHANGFVFVREGVDPPAAVMDAARLALGASGLDFGAVDVIWNAQQERAYVLEINTAPGLEGQTVQDYAAFFRGTA